MYLRRCYRNKDGKRHAYWALVKSVRTACGPRQEVVAYLGEMDEAGRLGIKQAAAGEGGEESGELFGAPPVQWVQVNVEAMRVENGRTFGGPWLGLEILRKLGLVELLQRLIPPGREEVPWPMMALVLVLGRLCDPSSELHIAEHFYEQCAIGRPAGRACREGQRGSVVPGLGSSCCRTRWNWRSTSRSVWGTFRLEYDLLLYDVTSTYFEGQAWPTAMADAVTRGTAVRTASRCASGWWSAAAGCRWVTKSFAGNRADVTTLQEIVTTMEERYGKAERIWVMDRGMIAAGQHRVLKGRRPALHRRHAQGDAQAIREATAAGGLGRGAGGLEVKLCPGPEGAGDVHPLPHRGSAGQGTGHARAF